MNITRILTIAILFAFHSELLATDIEWIDITGGDFEDSTNWSTGIVPTGTERAIFNNDAATPYTVYFNQPVTTVHGLDFGTDQVVLDLQGYTLTNDGTTSGSLLNLGINDYDETSVNIINGVISSNTDEYIGSVAGSNATLSLDNVTWNSTGGNTSISVRTSMNTVSMLNISNSTVNLNDDLDIEREFDIRGSGHGILNINSGSTVNADIVVGGVYFGDGTGELHIDGPGTTVTGRTDIGSEGTGIVTVSNGGSLVTHIDQGVGQGPLSEGHITATGAGSHIQVIDRLVLGGEEGNAFLSVLDGATVSVDQHLTMGGGENTTASLLVSGPGSRLSFGSIFTSEIGYFGEATVQVNNGGQIHATGHLHVNNAFPHSATYPPIQITIDGADSAIYLDSAGPGAVLDGILRINGGDRAHVNISNGGLLNVLNKIEGGGNYHVSGAGSRLVTGTLDLAPGWVMNAAADIRASDGGNVIVENDVVVNDNATFTLAGGTLSAHTVIVNGGVFDMKNGRLDANFFNGDLVNHGGTVSPGDIDAVEGERFISIEGDYLQETLATISFEIGGTEAGISYEFLEALNNITLAGTLDVSLVNGFSPQEGDSFNLLQSDTISGDFDAFILPVLGSGLAWDTAILEDAELGSTDYYTLSVVSSVPLPAAAWLFIAGLATLGFLGRSRKNVTR